MTLPASGALSLSDVLTELQVATPSRAAPISLGDADVLKLAGLSAAPVSLSDLYGKSSYIAMTLTGKSYYGGNISSAYSGGTATATPSVTVAGGIGPFTYAWSITSQTGQPSLSNATNATCSVTQTYLKGASGSFDAFLQCVVTDSTGRTATVANIEATISWGVPV